jgi:hypothetical protein
MIQIINKMNVQANLTGLPGLLYLLKQVMPTLE